MRNDERKSGILLHITSLPSEFGIGSLGEEAYRFVDFLKKAKQSYWQILPLCPPGFGNSPYQSFSTFAGNPYLIDLQLLQKDGLLLEEELSADGWGERADEVDFPLVYGKKDALFEKAFDRFRKAVPSDYTAFLKENSAWLDEYALFMAVKKHFGDVCWSEWEQDIRTHAKKAIDHYQILLKDQIEYQRFLQYEFVKQWQQLRTYANRSGIRIIGDVPIYVPLDSADVWAAPENFQLNRSRRPKVVAGCPPDGFSRNGQYWGNPIYDWDKMAQEGFDWWCRRIGVAVKQFDMVRIDHFRGMESYWSIPAKNKTARKGQWVKGPGMQLISALQKACPDADFIAEDLGFLTPEVRKLVADSGFPGMKVLEFAFDPREPSNYLPHNYDENCVCYTGTHDNETLSQWCASISEESDRYARQYLKIKEQDDLADTLIRAGMESKAKLFVAQMQDYLRLGADARMNEPGVVKPQNWRWRMLPGAADDALAAKIAALTEKSGRAEK